MDRPLNGMDRSWTRFPTQGCLNYYTYDNTQMDLFFIFAFKTVLFELLHA